MFPAAFMAFVEKRPIGVMARAIVERFLEAEHLDALFRRTAIEQYERELLFSSVVDLMQAVVLGVEPSVLAAFAWWSWKERETSSPPVPCPSAKA